MNLELAKLYDQRGRDIFKSLLDQYEVVSTFTDYWSVVDVYFNCCVGEVKYRTHSYSSYIIEEKKLQEMLKLPIRRKYYIVVLDNKIHFWSLDLCQKYPKVTRKLRDSGCDPDSIEIEKEVRFLPVCDCDYTFVRSTPDEDWQLLRFC